MARVSNRRREVERRRLVLWAAALLCVFSVSVFVFQVFMDRWNQHAGSSSGEVEPTVPTAEETALTMRSASASDDPSDKFLGQRIQVRGHLRRYYPGAIELVPGRSKDLTNPELLVEANLNVRGWRALQSAVREEDSRLYRLRLSELGSEEIGSAIMVTGTLLSNNDGKWLLVDCDRCSYQEGYHETIAVDATVPVPDSDPFGLNEVMARKNLKLNGRSVRSVSDVTDVTDDLRAQAASAPSPASLAASQSGDGDPIVMRLDLGGKTYNVSLSTWRNAEAKAKRYPGKSASDIVIYHMVYESLVDHGMYPSQAAALVMRNTGVPIMPSPMQLSAEITSKRDATLKRIEAMERAYR